MSDAENMYDEFGNYIGPELDSYSSEYSDEEEKQRFQFKKKDDKPDEPFAPPEGPNDNLKQVERPETPTVADAAADENEKTALQKMVKNTSSQIVLHEDKQYFPNASVVYPDAEVITQLEDTQPIETPIIAPAKTRVFYNVEKALPETSFSYRFMTKMMENPLLIRNMSFLGQLHHGKTLFVDMLVRETHLQNWPIDKEIRYT
ncbi:hypothetical protein MHBO_002259, partial [Bonamia ostreae]